MEMNIRQLNARYNITGQIIKFKHTTKGTCLVGFMVEQ